MGDLPRVFYLVPDHVQDRLELGVRQVHPKHKRGRHDAPLNIPYEWSNSTESSKTLRRAWGSRVLYRPKMRSIPPWQHRRPGLDSADLEHI